MATVLLTGGNGLIGRYLSIKLNEKGYDVAILSRKRDNQSPFPTYLWNPGKKEIEQKAIDTADYIIHLAGEGIGDKRWTAKRKRLIVESRTQTCDLLFEKFTHLKAFISASAVGYYGLVTSDKIFRETDPPSDDFLGRTCQQWEESANQFRNSGIRTVIIRTAPVFTERGGILSRFLSLARMGLGTVIGNGKQYLPWIHINDLCNIYIKALEDERMEGAYNAVAPTHINFKEFSMLLALSLNKIFWLPNIPASFMKCVFGEMSGMLLRGSRISSDKIREAGYEFRFPEPGRALENLLKGEK